MNTDQLLSALLEDAQWEMLIVADFEAMMQGSDKKRQASNHGIHFYHANENIWLADDVPAEFIEFE